MAAQTGVRISYSKLKRVEDGERKPDAKLICALEQLLGHTPSPVLAAYAAGHDLLRHKTAVTSAQGDTRAADLAAATRQIHDLERQLADLRERAAETQSIASRLLQLSVRDGETEAARTPQPKSARRARAARD